MEHGSKKYVNLGCGTRFHPAWTNIDLVACGEGVIVHDLSRGIPLGDGTCDLVYHSHVLEHIRPEDVGRFMHECFRVLKPQGVMRVVVPDLERICRLYLEKLDQALAGDSAAALDYNWMVLEMYDQTVREHWKSAMWRYLHENTVLNEAFVRQRIGEFKSAPREKTNSMLRRIRRFVRSTGRNVVDRLEWIKAVRALRIGYFRLSGEVHQWMYDRYSLKALLLDTGFVEPTQQRPAISLVANWAHFNLDTSPDGSAYKPDSLYMEAIKP